MTAETTTVTLPAEAVTVLLHQFSEWVDRVDPWPDDLTHDDLVEMFLKERSERAWPELAEPEAGR